MKIIAQKSNTLNTRDFFENALSQPYIDAMSFDITYTKDNKIVVFNANTIETAVTNTINNSTLNELQNYEIVLLDDLLKNLSKNQTKKELYINLIPANTVVLNDDNIQAISLQMNHYVEAVKKIIDQYQNLVINIHSISRNLVTILKKQITNRKIGIVIVENDLNFIDVNYYVLIANTQHDNIINILLNNNKEVIIYIYSDYYISYMYEHYLGEKSTPALQQMFAKIGIMSNYPTIIHKIFES